MPHIFPHQNHAVLENENRQRVQPTRHIVGRLGMGGTERVLDIGAGTGYVTFAIAREYPASLVYAMDLQAEMLALLAPRIRTESPGNVRPLQGKASSIPLAGSSLDLAILVNTFHELADPKAALCEIERVLKSGGLFWLLDFQKIDGSFGPPIHERISPDEVTGIVGSMCPGFKQGARYEEEEWYLLGFRKRHDPGEG